MEQLNESIELLKDIAESNFNALELCATAHAALPQCTLAVRRSSESLLLKITQDAVKNLAGAAEAFSENQLDSLEKYQDFSFETENDACREFGHITGHLEARIAQLTGSEVPPL